MNQTSEYISCKKGYKYQLVEEYATDTGILPGRDTGVDDYLSLTCEGRLTIKRGYAWDGPSGPTMDTLNFMRGSLVHDALYQLMRNHKLSKDEHRRDADKLLRETCREDGMNVLRAWLVYWGVRLTGDPAADPANQKLPIAAPKSRRQP